MCGINLKIYHENLKFELLPYRHGLCSFRNSYIICLLLCFCIFNVRNTLCFWTYYYCFATPTDLHSDCRIYMCIFFFINTRLQCKERSSPASFILRPSSLSQFFFRRKYSSLSSLHLCTKIYGQKKIVIYFA